MKLKSIRWIALLAGSILGVIFIGLGVFAAGSFISGITGDAPGATPGIEKVDLEWIREFIWILTMFLIPLSVLLAWFRNKTGGYLITIFAVLHIVSVYEANIGLYHWAQILILPVGPLLLLYVYFNKR